MTAPTLESGYAFRSSARWPREPETHCVSPGTLHSIRHVGTARIDGVACNAWRTVARPGARRVYYFQTAFVVQP